MPLRLEAAILSRMRSPVTSRSNWAKDSSTLSVSRPIEVVVLNCWVTETNETEAGVDLAHDCLSRQAAAVRTGTHPAIHFGRDDHLVAAGEVLDSPAEDLLAAAERITVRGVEEIDAAFERPLDERAGLLLGEAPGMVTAIGRAVAHAAEADARDVEAGAAELHIFHRLSRRLSERGTRATCERKTTKRAEIG